jgi:superfamily I DNA/RNA helicase
LEAADNAKNGSIETINSDDFVNEVTTTETLVLSRVTSPLISYALRCMNAGKKSIIKGMDIGEKLASIVRKFEVTTIPEVYDRLDIWVENATKRLQVQYKSADHIEDMKDCILVLLESCATLEEYYKKIEAMFSDKETTGILFSTIHKAKGLEAENVYILQPEKIPLVRKDQSPTDIQQEQNCALVAYTRSKNRMVFVKDTTKPKKNKKTETDTDNDNE